MGIKSKKIWALLCALAVGVAVASTAAASHSGTPGVTKKQITIGGTFPFTGGASAYKTIPVAEAAYYAYLNAHGGVNGRMIKDIQKDDAYNPAQTVPAVQQLVEQDHVFAIVGSLGTAPGLATWGYLNQNKVPQVLLATGDAYWGNCVHHACSGSTKPWTMGWQPDYPGEAKLYAHYILSHKSNAKIGVLYQNDAYGKNYLAGLKAGLGSNSSEIVDAEPYNFGDSAQVVIGHVGALKAHGADTFVIFATPTASGQALVGEHILGWSPLTLLNNVSANRVFLLPAGQSGANPDGVISTSYVPTATANASQPGVKLAKAIIHKYASALDADFAAGDSNITYGLASAWTFAQALKRAGANPTRAGLMHALRSMNYTNNPFLLPGFKVQTSKMRTFPMEQLQFIKWSGGSSGDWKAFGKVVNSGH
jgi:branched-chain amino acid transport system substrate-binding protein